MLQHCADRSRRGFGQAVWTLIANAPVSPGAAVRAIFLWLPEQQHDHEKRFGDQTGGVISRLDQRILHILLLRGHGAGG